MGASEEPLVESPERSAVSGAEASSEADRGETQEEDLGPSAAGFVAPTTPKETSPRPASAVAEASLDDAPAEPPAVSEADDSSNTRIKANGPASEEADPTDNEVAVGAAPSNPKRRTAPNRSKKSRKATKSSPSIDVGPDPAKPLGVSLWGLLVMAFGGFTDRHYVFDAGLAFAVGGALVFIAFVLYTRFLQWRAERSSSHSEAGRGADAKRKGRVAPRAAP